MTKYEILKSELSKEKLKHLLLKQQMTYREIQEEYGYDERRISKLAKEYNIPKDQKVIKINANKNKVLNTKDSELLKYYLDDKLSIRAIAKIYNCTHATISNKLKKLKVDIRSGYDKLYYKYRNTTKRGFERKEFVRIYRAIIEEHIKRKLTALEHVHHINFNREDNVINNLFLFKTSEDHLAYHGFIKSNVYIHPRIFVKNILPKYKITFRNKSWLYEEYITKGKSINRISKEINMSRITISNYLKKFEILDKRKKIVNQFDDQYLQSQSKEGEIIE